VTNRDRITRACVAGGATVPQGERIASAMLAELDAAGLVILPAVANVRMRHEACKGGTGITTGAFALMWEKAVAYGRTLNGPATALGITGGESPNRGDREAGDG
jgi:hypothetical protein